jgi:CheY-like chemotaxis protein
MGNPMIDAGQLLDALDESDGQEAGAAKRQAPRRSWRKRLKVNVTHPGGDRRSVEVVTRNLSSTGLSFLYNGFLHSGTRCELQLINSDETWVEVEATVVRCRYIAGRVHEVGLRLNEPVDKSQIVSQELSATVLLVDDAEDVLRLTSHFLSKTGARVITANRGDRALELIAENEIDLVLLDVEMPGISGPAVAQTLRDRGMTIPIIAYTAHDDPATREACLAAGCSDVLTKPLGQSELADALARYLVVEEPITSCFAADPEMAEFIREFVSSLPARVQELQRCLQSRNTEDLGRLCRQLKIAASDKGGCGFGELSAAAEALLVTLTGTVDWTRAGQAMSALSNLASRVKEAAGHG